MIYCKNCIISFLEKTYRHSMPVMQLMLCTILVSLYSTQVNSAEKLTTCSISAKVVYAPALVDGFYWITIAGTSFKKISGDFCRDRVGKQARIRVPEYVFSTTARPKLYSDITLIESREIITVGHDQIEIRYFTEMP